MAGIAVGVSPEAMRSLCDFDEEEGRSVPKATGRCIVIDCRPFIAFNAGHVAGAVNVHCPSILKRRSRGTLQLQSVISSDRTRNDFLEGQYSSAVLYDDSTSEVCDLNQDSVVVMAIKAIHDTKRLSRIYFLQGGYELFSRRFDRLCRRPGQLPDGSSSAVIPTVCITGPSSSSSSFSDTAAAAAAASDLVRSTRELQLIDDAARPTIGASAATGAGVLLAPPDDKLDAEDGRKERLVSPEKSSSSRFHLLHDRGDPVLVLPWLYIGNSYHASQEGRLRQRLGLTARLNVAGQQASPVYAESRDFRCLSIPVTDTSTENIISWFPEANDFIESIRESDGRVLVHCEAGISRSATICIAYLMYRNNLTLDEAYDFIQAKRSIISPNLNFMHQLVEYEKQLSAARKQQKQQQQQQLSIDADNQAPSEGEIIQPSTAADQRPSVSPSVASLLQRQTCRSFDVDGPSSFFFPACGGGGDRRIRRSSFDLGRQDRIGGGPGTAHRARHFKSEDDDAFSRILPISGILLQNNRPPCPLSPLVQS